MNTGQPIRLTDRDLEALEHDPGTGSGSVRTISPFVRQSREGRMFSYLQLSSGPGPYARRNIYDSQVRSIHPRRCQYLRA